MQIRIPGKMAAIGLMSGTSMDGIDLALVISDGEGEVERRGFASFGYPAAFRTRLEKAMEEARNMEDRDERPGILGEVEREITRRHGEAVAGFLAQTGEHADLIGFHGQTVLHRPERGLTVQLGNGAELAAMCGLPVVHDMRANDMAHGGQGAPLVPAYHAALARNLPAELSRFPVAFVNIGGIANITWVSGEGELIAFDTGPGNALIDQWVQAHAGIPYDQNGAIAAEGSLVPALVEHYLEAPFLSESAPKSLDRSDFPPLSPDAAELSDGARSLAAVTAHTIIRACDHLPELPALWLICGGGRLNRVIMADLAQLARELNGARVLACEEAGFNGDAMEAEAWAYLAIRSLKGLPLSFPSTTGCNAPVSGGLLAHPDGRQHLPT